MIVIKNDLNQVYDYTMFYGILNIEVWMALFGLCLLPSLIITTQEILMDYQKFSCRKFIFRLFESKMCMCQ